MAPSAATAPGGRPPGNWPPGMNGMLPGGIAPGIIGIPGGAIIPPGGIAGIWAPACTTPGFMLTALSGTLCIISCLACQLLTGGAVRYGAAIGTGSPHGPVKPGTVGVEDWPGARPGGSP